MTTYPIFLSSLCKELWDLRARLYHDVGQGQYIYVDEQVSPRDTPNQDDLAVADELIRRVREASLFVCVLGGNKHGTLLRVGNRPSRVSFFEIELFQATLLRKPIHIFVRQDFDPEPRLANLLKILEGAFSEWLTRERWNDEGIIGEVRRLVAGEQRRHWLTPVSALQVPIRRLVQALFTARVRRGAGTPLFLEGRFEPRPDGPNLDFVSDVLNKVRTLPNHEQRLSRLWVAMRELMSSPHTQAGDRAILAQWNELLGLWARAGSWYGLHGDTSFGALAALNAMASIRQRLYKLGSAELSPSSVGFPGGALASAKYSIAKRLYVPADRTMRLQEALEDVTRALAEGSATEDGLRGIRASIFRQLGKFSAAVAEYESVLAIRRRNGALEAPEGEAMSELGFAYLGQGRLWRGRAYCEEGVRLLRSGPIDGFYVRALRKLSIAYAITGHPRKALKARSEARTAAETIGALDQLRRA